MMAVTKICPCCGKLVPFTREQAEKGALCPECGTFIESRHITLTEDDCRKFAAAIHQLMREEK